MGNDTSSTGTSETDGIDVNVPPSGPGCVECTQSDGWWLHLRRCTQCGHVGCCDSSPSQHASKHNQTTGHPNIASFEPDEGWFFNYASGSFFDGPQLAPPRSHPVDQPAPGPAGKVPANWQELLHR